MRDYINILASTSGEKLEEMLMDEISRFAIKNWGKGAFKFSAIKQDRLDGVDFFVLGVPVDVTLNYNRKNRMRKLDISLSFEGISVDFGIRFGNGKAQFKTPVLVIGIDSALRLTHSNMAGEIGLLRDGLDQILNSGMDAYFDACDVY